MRRARRWLLLVMVVMCCAPFSALAASGLKVVSYHGFRVNVPRAWPVYDLARDPAVCVRFNRHAVYLGRPSADQRCPARVAGRTDAILLAPVGASGIARSALPGTPGGSAGSLLNHARRIVVTATWNGNGDAIRRALGVHSLTALRPSPDPNSQSALRTAMDTAAPGRSRVWAMARIASAAPSIAGGVYTGLGFDTCSAPSSARMSAWRSSPYRTVGVYIGGSNMACAQPNLTPAWVSRESAAGWHLIPIYVGLQAPSNSCACAAISGGRASSQGRAAARDAVNRAQALGMGPGNPIYFDMEAYPRGGTNSAAALSFLGGWTTQLHAEGYRSGVYSSDGSGVSDLVSRASTGYPEPDELYFANWNGVSSTSDASVPGREWPNHQRVHQYQGVHNETHGGVTISIDSNYINAATAAAGSTAISRSSLRQARLR